jgi:hypothetical protein
MAFANDIVGGTTLIRQAINSANYVPGVSGWSINRDGSAEFASGTFRGPVIVEDPTTGQVLASIGANGNGSFQNVYVNGDVIIGTLSVLAAIEQAPRGVVGRFTTTGTMPAIPGGNTLADICWLPFTIDPTRMYALYCTTNQIANVNISNTEDFTFNVVVNQPGGYSGTIHSTVHNIGPKGSPLNIKAFMTFSVAGPATVKLQASNDSSSTPYSIITTSGFTMWVEDIGPILIEAGGTGSPTGATQYTSIYSALGSSSWDSSGNFIGSPDGTNNMYTGGLSGRSHGSNESSLWTFDGSTIASDISGATIQQARLYMYCTNSSGASGGCFTSWRTNATPPSTSPGTGASGQNNTNNWPKPGWGFVDISGQLSNITGGGCKSIMLQSTTLSGSASFYGFGTGAPYLPYLTITYTK